MTGRCGGVRTSIPAALTAVLLTTLGCADGPGSGATLRIEPDSYGGTYPVFAEADDADLSRALEELSCSMTGGTCSIEFAPPASPTVVRLRLDTTGPEWWRARVMYGGDCDARGELVVSEAREYACRASTWTHIGLSSHWYGEANIACTSTGLVCTPRYRMNVSNHAPLSVALGVTLPASQCANLIFRTYVDGQLTSGTLPIALGSSAAVEVEAELVPGGCLGDDLREWRGLVKIVGQVTVTPEPGG